MSDPAMVRSKALELPEQDRIDLVFSLVHSLETAPPQAKISLHEEVCQRHAALEGGECVLHNADDSIEQIRQNLRGEK